MKTLMKKQMFFGFVIFALAGMMITAQMPLAFAADMDCVNETLSGPKQTNIRVIDLSDIPIADPDDEDGWGPDGKKGTQDDGLNICVFDNIDHKGNTFIEANALLLVTNGSNDDGDIKLEGEGAEIHFESTDRVDSEGEPIINTKKGNIQLQHEGSYAYIESLNLDGNINGKGELYISSNSDRLTPVFPRDGLEVFIDGNILLAGNGDNELRVDGGEITGNLRVFKNHSYVITNAIIGGNLDIKDAFLSSDFVGFENYQDLVDDSFITIEGNDIGGNLMLQDNNLPISIDGSDVGGNVICKKNNNLIDDEIQGDSSTNHVDGKALNQCSDLFDKDDPNF